MTQPPVLVVHLYQQRTLGRILLAVGTLAVTVLCALLVPGAAYANTNRVELVNVATKLRADVMWASTQDGQNVFLWVNNTSASQLFDLINMGDGYFQIRARHSSKWSDAHEESGHSREWDADRPVPLHAPQLQVSTVALRAHESPLRRQRSVSRQRLEDHQEPLPPEKVPRHGQPSGHETPAAGGPAVVDLYLKNHCLERRQPNLEDLGSVRGANYLPARLKSEDPAGCGVFRPAGSGSWRL